MSKNIKQIIKDIPHSPGCYRYFNKKGELIYIGKAKDLKKRVYSYFVGKFSPRSDLGESPRSDLGVKTQVLVENIADIKWEVTESEIEALILESLLIKKYKPKFNIKVKDDKDFLWVKIDMRQEFPMPELVRPIKLPLRGFDGVNRRKIKFFGPFTDSKLLKQGLTILRKIFLWRDCSESKFSFYKKKDKPCLEYYIKNCSAPCQESCKFVSCKQVSIDNGIQKGIIANKELLLNKNEYQLAIKQLILFLQGGKKKLMNDLERKMKRLSKQKKFEEAVVVRNKLRALEGIAKNIQYSISNIQSISNTQYLISNIKYLKNFIKILNNELGYTFKFKSNFRIEFYDISNTSGKEAVGSMVVWQDSSLKKNEYRKFKIKFIKGPNDVGMMREVLFRRAKYFGSNQKDSKFKDPDLIVLDGGKPQLGEIAKLFSQLKIDIPVISLAKEQEEILGIKGYKVIKFVKLGIAKNSPEGFFIQRLRDEAHRFAIGYHKVLREKKVISSRLNSIEGIGPKLKKKLLLKFGSVDGIIKTDLVEIEKVVGKKLAKKIKESL